MRQVISAPHSISLEGPKAVGNSTVGVWNRRQSWSLTHLTVNAGCRLGLRKAVVGNIDL